jgi:HEAT repeat protein
VRVTAVDAEKDALCNALQAAGVRGVHDFGRFVNNTADFRESDFDDAAAAPVLLAQLPRLTQPQLVAATVRHLRHVDRRALDFETLVGAFRSWAARDLDAGWALADAVAYAAGSKHAETMCGLAKDRSYGRSRQMIVHALWRWRKSDDVEPTLRDLVTDPDVALHAMVALARVISPNDMIAVLEPLTDDADASVRNQAHRQLSKIRRKLAGSA